MAKKLEPTPKSVSSQAASKAGFPPSELEPQFNCRMPQSTKNDIKWLKKQLKLSSEGRVVVRAIRKLKAETKKNA